MAEPPDTPLADKPDCRLRDAAAQRRSGPLIRRRLARPCGHVHMVGVCGIGMAGVAFLLKARGFRVSGCDRSLNSLAAWLARHGVDVQSGHDAGHACADVDWMVRTAAVPLDALEIARAIELGIPVFSRGTVLPELLAGQRSVAVSGTHGKTTTTSFIAQAMAFAGRDPSWCIGGENDALGGVAGAGRGGIIVVEADESDGTVALYRPDVAVITNIEFDHMEHFASVEDFQDCFRALAAGTRGRVVYCADDPRAADLGRSCGKGLAYGFARESAIRGSRLEMTDSALRFRVEAPGGLSADLCLPVPGRHNALNALAATAACLELGLTLDEVASALARVRLPARRFQWVVRREGVGVVSDYAHHPTEVAALVRTARQQACSRLVAVFQPHRYTRTLALGSDFPPAFEGVDELVLLPVYAASEAPLAGGNTWDLYQHFRSRADDRRTARVVRVASSLEQAWWHWRRQLRPGDLLLVIGAGSVARIADWAEAESGLGESALAEAEARRAALAALLRESEVRGDEPLAGRTTMGAGGSAELWVAVGTERDLVALLRWTRAEGVPFHLLGAGSNVVVSDLGVRGVVARLAGAGFLGVSEADGEVRAGAGVPLARLLDWAEERGWSGLEFLEGIPGLVGGALRMNAGAWGAEIGGVVSWIRCLNSEGAAVIVRASEVGFGYRRCSALEEAVAVEAGLRLQRGDPRDIRARRAERRQRRLWMRGMRCAGSVFRNPPGEFAGRLIEQAGLKGTAIGGASVAPAHGNVIVAGEGANASDVCALMSRVQECVAAQFGVRLESEIVVLE